jgi:hypothetical protein
MSRESRMLGGILFVVIPSVMFGGLSLLHFLTRNEPVMPIIRCATTSGVRGMPTPASISSSRS